jgi:hypothetical protein
VKRRQVEPALVDHAPCRRTKLPGSKRSRKNTTRFYYFIVRNRDDLMGGSRGISV